MRVRFLALAITAGLSALVACNGDDTMVGASPDGEVGGAHAESGAGDDHSVSSSGSGGVDSSNDGSARGPDSSDASVGVPDSSHGGGAGGHADVGRDGCPGGGAGMSHESGPDGISLSSDASDSGRNDASPEASMASDANRAESGGDDVTSDVATFVNLVWGDPTTDTATMLSITAPFFGNQLKTYEPFGTNGNASTGPITLTNTDAQDFPAEIFSCTGVTSPIAESPSSGLEPGSICFLEVFYTPQSPGLHTTQITLSAAPGGTITLTVTGRQTVAEGRTGCTDALDCPASCGPCPGGATCPPCQAQTCLTAFFDFDGDGYGFGNPTTVCNRILPGITFPPLSLTSNDCDDRNAALHPGASICGSGDDPTAVVTCREDGTLDVQTCDGGACSNGQCVGDAGADGP